MGDELLLGGDAHAGQRIMGLWLLGKLNSALDPETGLTIVISGSGSFDVSQPSISGGGSYTIVDAGGSVVGSGTWTATTFDSFTPTAPGGSPGEGGRLELEASFNGTGLGALQGPMGALGGKLLKDMGFVDVSFLKGGVKAWQDAGLPTEKVAKA